MTERHHADQDSQVQGKISAVTASSGSFGAWTGSFTDPLLCAATADRLTCGSDVIDTRRKSFRLASAQAGMGEILQDWPLSPATSHRSPPRPCAGSRPARSPPMNARQSRDPGRTRRHAAKRSLVGPAEGSAPPGASGRWT